VHHNAWYVRYRERVGREDGSIKLKQRAARLGSVTDYPFESHIKPRLAEFMCSLNAGNFSPEPGITLGEFVERIYLPYLSEKRASTKKGYEEIWDNHISDRVGHIQLRKFRTVNASRMLKAIADENDLSKTTLQHIKGVLSGIFTHARNEGAFDDANPVQGARIPTNAREPDETYAYNLAQICRILEFLPLLPKAVIATAAFAGLRRGELRGLEWTDYSGDALNVKRSVWKAVVNQPKTRASAKPVPVIRQLAEILDTYRTSMGNPQSGVMFHTARASTWISISWFSGLYARWPRVSTSTGTACTGSVVASLRICMNWARTKKSFSASCVMQSRMSRRIATSRRSTLH
jgi:integrase